MVTGWTKQSLVVTIDRLISAGSGKGSIATRFTASDSNLLTAGGFHMTTRHPRPATGPVSNVRMEKSSNKSAGPRFPRMALRTLAAALALHLGLAAASADAIKLGDGLWVDNVAIDTFDGVSLHYLVNSVPQTKHLSDIDGFRLAAYPQLEEAEKSLKANKPKDVLGHFKAVRGKAKEPWLRIWLDARLVPLMDKEGEHLGALNTYIALVEAKASASFLADPPLRSAKAISKEDKTKVAEKLKTLRKAATDKSPLARSLDELIEAADPQVDAVKPPENPNAAPGTEGLLETVIPLPEFMLKGKTDPITRTLAKGRYAQALSDVNDELKAAPAGRASLLLFQRGIAQFYLAVELEKDPAKKAEAKQMFEDAGLSFYRIPTYFKNSPYVGPALLETAAVHLKINRPDVAKGLLDLAGAQIDPDDKLLKERLDKLSEQVASAVNK